MLRWISALWDLLVIAQYTYGPDRKHKDKVLAAGEVGGTEGAGGGRI